MTSGGNSSDDLPELVPTTETTSAKIEKTFLVLWSVTVGLFHEWAQRRSINNTLLNPVAKDAWCVFVRV